MALIAFVGFGELGSSLAEGLSKSGRHTLRAYLRGLSDPDALTHERLRATGTERCRTLEAAVAGADAVLAVVPARAAAELAPACAVRIRPGALYVDFTSCAPEQKRCAERLLAEAGALYADAAVLGTVVVSGFAVPILASGPGARDLHALAAPAGLRVSVTDRPTGAAATVKLLRSVYLKGRDALVIETLLAARRYDVEDLVVESLQGPSERVEFRSLAERLLRGVALHAERRADELEMAAEMLGLVGVDAGLARAGVARLRRVAALGLRQRLGHDGAQDVQAVLAAIEELSDRAAAHDAPASPEAELRSVAAASPPAR
jgi:3-hydroxyisobutyrate dehydrogenase-like beta-hydroxyacid dehydrogenase